MVKTKKKRVVLLDTHAILHRAYHALPDFTSPSGDPTGALYGLTAFLLKVLDDLHPDYIIAAYDLPGPTLRHEMYEDYKGTREKTDDSLVSQLQSSRDILNALSVPYIEAPGYEADDILGTLSEVFKKDKALEVLIASGDMDTLQLVDKKAVQVYTLKRGINDTIVYDETAVKDRYGFGPELVVDYKGLRGDPSDNIPGIRGIGEKTATALITNFGDIESIYKTLKEHPEKFEKAGIKPRIMNLLTEGEDDALFSKELATIHRDVPIDTPVLSTEWTGNIILEDSLSVFKELGFRTLSERLKKKLGSKEEVEEVKEEKVEEKVNTKELEKVGLMLWVLRSDITNPTLEDMLEYTNKSTFAEAKEAILGELEEQKLNEVYENIELPLIPVVHRMEKRGILLDTEYLKTLSRRYHKDLDALEKRIYKTAGEEFNIKSPKQLGEILFEKLGIGGGKGKKTATGQRSTRESELKKYEKDEPIIKDILEYRELQKLLSTYIDNLPKMTDSDGRLHAHFSQTGTTTGRMSSAAPNMQNIPIRSSRGNAIRKAIQAPKGHVLMSADYSQIELRVAAFISGDEKLIAYFKEDKDIHTAVAAAVFDVDESDVTKDMRRKAKVINFGILYGMGSNALAVAAETSRKEAKQYLEEYFERFEGVRQYAEDIKNTLRKNGYTETWFGRKRYFEGIKSPLPHIQAQAERMAMNAPIQGTEADIMKLAMVEIDKKLRSKKLQNDAFLTAQIHDELLYEVKEEKVEEVKALIQKTMESIMSLEDTCGIPLKVDIEISSNWGDMKG